MKRQPRRDAPRLTHAVMVLPLLGLLLCQRASLQVDQRRAGRPPLPPAPTFPRTTVSQPGESLSAVARRAFGDDTRWPEIYQLNRARIGEDPDHLRAGQELLLREELTAAQLQRLLPSLPAAQVDSYTTLLNGAMAEFGITTRRRQVCFLAQLAHESGELTAFEEHASGAAYEGRCEDLGNCEAGDGTRYKGRGPIQLTGKKNYRQAGQALGVDLVTWPELAAQAQVGFRVAAWFFRANKLNQLADAGDFHEITQRINGGQEGQRSREGYLARACQVLAVACP